MSKVESKGDSWTLKDIFGQKVINAKGLLKREGHAPTPTVCLLYSYTIQSSSEYAGRSRASLTHLAPSHGLRGREMVTTNIC